MTLANRAFARLDIKAVNEDRRVIRGVATTPTVDRVGDIIEPLGVHFRNPMPLLWQHRSDQPIGTVKFDKPTKDGITFVAELPEVEEAGTLQDRIEEAWQSIKLGLVRAVSIGFRAIEYAFMETGGIRFSEVEVYELSAVTIPANAEAVITSLKTMDSAAVAAIKQFDIGAPAASGQKRTESTPGVSGRTDPAHRVVKSNPDSKGTSAMDIGKSIASFEATRAAKAARMAEIMTGADERGETLTEEETTEYDSLAAEVKSVDDHLKRLHDMEAVEAANAKPIVVKDSKTGSEARVPAQVKATPKTEKGIEFARFAMCVIASKGNHDMALRLAKTHYGQNERIVKSLEAIRDRGSFVPLMKANVEAGTTLDSAWAGALVDYENFAGDFVEWLRPQTIVGQFGTGSIPDLNRIPFNVRIAGQTSGGAAYWVGQGAPKPLTAFDFTATELRWNKIATIAVLTEEVIRFSNPAAERLVREAIGAAVIERLDIDFVDPAKTAVADVSPASITNGATAVPSSGTDADAIRADIQALWAPFIAARNPPRTAVYIMDSTTALALSMMQNPLGQAEFPGLTMNGGTFMGVPVIVSDYLPVDTAGGMVVLVNARDIWLADDGQVTIDASREASLQMLDNPTNNSATATATSMVSMFQTNSVAFRAERFINWARRRTSGVAYLTGVQWGQ